MMKRFLKWGVLVSLVFLGAIGCSKKGNDSSGGNNNPPPPPPPPVTNEVDFWLTKGNKSVLFAKQNVVLGFNTTVNQAPVITVDTTQKYQSIDGFGFALTGGSAQVLNAPNVARDALLTELFSTEGNAIGVSYLRVSVGASDLNAYVYTYDDMPAGQTDINLEHFSLDADRADVLPVLKKILQINPAIKILASPWTAPSWMKTNNSPIGGKLKPEYYGVYADYLVKYLQAMQAEGITIDALTPQNEPLNPHNNPSMEMTAAEQAEFIKNHLGPKLRAANLATKIIIYDHNADHPEYPISILNDAGAKQYIDGSAFHLYAGSISALSQVRDAHPDKNIYFTEQYVDAQGQFGGDLAWHVGNLIVGATRNWSKNVIEWNLANNEQMGPHTNGGCTSCLGALTIGSSITRNQSYYVVAHASKFVRPGSRRVASNITNNLQNVAFETPEGKKVLIVLNNASSFQNFNIEFKGKRVQTGLDAGAVGTYVW